MFISPKARTAALRTIETFAIGTAGGLLFWWLGLPGGQLTGSMIAVAIASLGGRTLLIHRYVITVMMIVVGVTLGSAVSPDMLRSLPTYAASLAVLAVCTAAVVVLCTAYLMQVHGWDRLSAVLASTPGSFSQMIILAIETRSDEIGVAIVQAFRMLLVTLLTPLVLVSVGFTPDPVGLVRPVAGAGELLLMLCAGIPVSLLLQWRRFPAPWLFGPMLASGLLHGFGIVHGGLPAAPLSIAMIGIGSAVGTRFVGIGIAALMRYLGAALGSLVVAFAVTAAFGLSIYYFLVVKPAELFVAFAPGAIDAMMALSLALHLDPLFVGAHHMLRFLEIVFFIPLVIKFGAPKADIDAAAKHPANLED